MPRVFGVIAAADSVSHQFVIGRIERDQYWLAMLPYQRGVVISVVRLEENDFVAGIEQSAAGCIESAGSAGGDQDLGIGIGDDAVLPLQLAGDRVAQASDAVEPGVLIEAGFDGSFRRVPHDFRNFGVAYPLRQIDAANFVALHRHGANGRLHDAAGDIAQSQHLCRSSLYDRAFGFRQAADRLKV